MNILLVATKYPEEFNDSYLTSDLADEWVRAGHKVTVVSVQWDRKGSNFEKEVVFPSGVRVLYFAPISINFLGRFVDRVTRWTLSSLLLNRKIRGKAGQPSDYDAAIFFAPSIVNWRLILTYAGAVKNNYLYISDFFPFQARNIGLVPKGAIFDVVKRLENHFTKKFATVGTMTPMNAAFYRENFDVPAGQRVVVDPLWGPDPMDFTRSKAEIRAEFELPQDKKLLLLGGQLCEGRGIDEIIGAARIYQERSSDIAFLLIGDGRLRPQVEEAAAALPDNLYYRPPVSRDRYLELASACDAGLVVTDPTINAPTFSTRTIDYMRVGLPILASTEACTDFGDIILEAGVGLHMVAGNPEKFVALADEIFADPARYERMRAACIIAANGRFNVRNVARNMLAHAMGTMD